MAMSAEKSILSRPASDWRNPAAWELSQDDSPYKSWAWRLRGRELSGDQLSIVQRRFWREALASEIAT